MQYGILIRYAQYYNLDTFHDQQTCIVLGEQRLIGKSTVFKSMFNERLKFEIGIKPAPFHPITIDRIATVLSNNNPTQNVHFRY